MKLLLPFPKVFYFLICFLFATNLSAQQDGPLSLLQQNPQIFDSWLEGSVFHEMDPGTARTRLPDHFFAERIYPEKLIQPIVFEFGDQAAVVFWAMDVGDSEVIILSDKQDEGLFFYEFNDNRITGLSGRMIQTISSPLTGQVILEWNGPVNMVDDFINSCRIRTYRALEGQSFSSTGFGASLDCHFNINCPEGENFIHISDGVCRVMVVVEEGIGFCSGALINNTAEDFTPYLLSAFHCMANFTPLFHLWRFDFFYESDNCDNPAIEPAFFSMTGAQFRAGHPDSDFLLLELNNDFPISLEVPFLGWDRREDYLPQHTALVHHPAADIKKVSLYSEPLRVHNNLINWNHGTQTPRRSHYRQQLTTGTFEPGSSGSPMLSPEARIMGQLHGGVFGCDNFIAYSGIFYYSWDVGDVPSERLKDWLDPLNTGQLTLDELFLRPEIKEMEIEGSVSNPNNLAIPGVLVELLCGDSTYLTQTDINGDFILAVSFLEDEVCSLRFSKEDAALNGINVLDIVLIRRDILGLQLLNDWQRLAADVNNDGMVNVLDIVVLRRLILGIYDKLPGIDPWLFVFDEDLIELRTGNDLFIEVTGLKMGDLDYNANY